LIPHSARHGQERDLIFSIIVHRHWFAYFLILQFELSTDILQSCSSNGKLATNKFLKIWFADDDFTFTNSVNDLSKLIKILLFVYNKYKDVFLEMVNVHIA